MALPLTNEEIDKICELLEFVNLGGDRACGKEEWAAQAADEARAAELQARLREQKQ